MSYYDDTPFRGFLSAVTVLLLMVVGIALSVSNKEEEGYTFMSPGLYCLHGDLDLKVDVPEGKIRESGNVLVMSSAGEYNWIRREIVKECPSE